MPGRSEPLRDNRGFDAPLAGTLSPTDFFTFFMKRTWLLFAQAVTVLLAAYFVVATLKPEWLNRRGFSQRPRLGDRSPATSPAAIAAGQL